MMDNSFSTMDRNNIEITEPITVKTAENIPQVILTTPLTYKSIQQFENFMHRKRNDNPDVNRTSYIDLRAQAALAFRFAGQDPPIDWKQQDQWDDKKFFSLVYSACFDNTGDGAAISMEYYKHQLEKLQIHFDMKAGVSSLDKYVFAIVQICEYMDSFGMKFSPAVAEDIVDTMI